MGGVSKKVFTCKTPFAEVRNVMLGRVGGLQPFETRFISATLDSLLLLLMALMAAAAGSAASGWNG